MLPETTRDESPWWFACYIPVHTCLLYACACKLHSCKRVRDTHISWACGVYYITHTCIHTCMHACMFMHAYSHRHSCMCLYRMYVCMCVCVSLRIHICTRACMFIFIHVCTHICMYVCYVCMHACIYVYFDMSERVCCCVYDMSDRVCCCVCDVRHMSARVCCCWCDIWQAESNHDTHRNESYHTTEWLISHKWLSLSGTTITREVLVRDESCHTRANECELPCNESEWCDVAQMWMMHDLRVMTHVRVVRCSSDGIHVIHHLYDDTCHASFTSELHRTNQSYTS